jgi:hypothetical protein
VVFTFFKTTTNIANGPSTSSAGVSSPLVLAAIGAGTLALVAAAAATIHFFKHRGDPNPAAKQLPPPPTDYATHAAENTAADASTGTGDTRSCMSPRSNASHTDETEPARGGDSHGMHRNPRVYRLSPLAIESSGRQHMPSHRDGTHACIGVPLPHSLSFEGDDDDDELVMDPAAAATRSSPSQSGGTMLSATDPVDESNERRYRDDHVPMPLPY